MGMGTGHIAASPSSLKFESETKMENPYKMKNKLLIIGAYGYTGKLIAREAINYGIQPIIAGRNEMELKALATELNLAYRVIALSDSDQSWHDHLQDVHTILHCAGPFILTFKNVLDQCLKNKVHYLDITGEIAVFEGVKTMDAAIRERGIMAMSGVGFDVVPTDCMAAFLHDKMPNATELELAFYSAGGGVSRGTANTAIENLGTGGAIRKNGKITKVPSAYDTKKIEFAEQSVYCTTIPWGDISTAYHTTKIPNIRVYMATSKQMVNNMKWMDRMGFLLKLPLAKNLLKYMNNRRPAGPTESQNNTAKSYIWGQVKNGNDILSANCVTPEGYKLTALTALLISKKVLAGDYKIGYQTPASCYGMDLIMEIPGVTRKLMPIV